MLSYRHAYHAGNHADVFKHLVLCELLSRLTRKAKPLSYIDTHAGAGVYALDSGPGAKQREFATGIQHLWSAPALPVSAQRYVDLVRRLNPDGVLRRYPGSPWFADQLTRPQDSLWLCELHPTDHAELERAAQAFRGNVHVVHGDGYAELKRLLPPPSRRALVMLDPAYELASDYAAVVTALAAALARFATGVYAVWYPLINDRQVDKLARQLARLGAPRWLHLRVTVRDRPQATHGLFGSGLYVINPPYTLAETLAADLPGVLSLLGQDDRAGFNLDSESP
jgi:23S rRNA (adenine2030-N6)-methyltransferase